MTLGGLAITVDPNLTEPKTVRRTWGERLFARPWRPFVQTKVIRVPSEQVYLLTNRLICHPAMLDTIRAAAGASHPATVGMSHPRNDHIGA